MSAARRSPDVDLANTAARPLRGRSRRPAHAPFVCPGELDLQNGGPDEYVEVRRLNGLLWRVAMHDGQSPHGVDDAMTDSLVPERYNASRLYPRHGLH